MARARTAEAPSYGGLIAQFIRQARAVIEPPAAVATIEEETPAAKESQKADDGSPWVEEPVDIITFYREFLGVTPFPVQEEFLVAMEGRDGRAWDTRYKEGTAIWGMGSGKDFIISGVFTYTAYRLMCLKHPQSYFGLGPGSTIDMVNVAHNAKQARAVFFSYFSSTIRRCTNPKTGQNWFAERGMDLRENAGDILTDWVRFPKDIRAFSLNSDAGAPEGANIIRAAFDEACRMRKDDARKLWDVLTKNSTSRFGEYGKVYLLSYPESEDDFGMGEYRRALADPEAFAMLRATWEVNLGRKRSDFDRHFRRDPEDARRKYECKPPRIGGGFFTFPERIEQCVDDRLPAVVEASPSITRRMVKVGDQMVPREFVAILIERFLVEPGPWRYHIHGDPGLKRDTFSIALGHGEPTTTMEPDDEGNEIEVPATRVVVDLLLEWIPEDGRPVDVVNVKDVLLLLCKHFSVEKVTFDRWNSAQQIQELQQAGIDAEDMSFSNPQQMGMYKNLRSLINNHLAALPGSAAAGIQSERLRSQLRNLILVNGNRVDHPAEDDEGRPGGKDLADAVAAIAARIAGEEPGVVIVEPATATLEELAGTADTEDEDLAARTVPPWLLRR